MVLKWSLFSSFLVWMILQAEGGRTNKCEIDHECGTGQYCYTKSGFCTSCTDCNDYHRNKPVYISCPKTPKDCGDCLPRYNIEYLTEGDIRDRCVPEPPSQDSSTPEYVYVIAGIAVVLVAFVAIILWRYCRRYRKNKERDRNPSSSSNVQDERVETGTNFQDFPTGNNIRDVPPPYYMPPTAPLLPAPDHGNSASTTEDIELKMYCPKEQTSLQGQATPFLYAGYPYGSNDEDIDEDLSPAESDGEVSEHQDSDPPHPYEDEDTMPSPWTAPPNYGQETSTPAAEQASTSLASIGEEENCVASNDEVEQAPQEEVENEQDTYQSDSGVSASNSSHTSAVSLQGTSRDSPQESRGVTRTHSDDDISNSSVNNKRPKRDSGTVSLNEDTISDSE